MTTELRMSTLAVLAHAAVVMVHGAAHSELHIGLSALGTAFVFLVILMGPFCALLLLKLGKRRIGAMTFFITMIGSLLFGLWNHFIVPGADHVGHLPDAAGKISFQATALLLLATEAFGTVIGLRLLRREPPFNNRR